MKGIPVECATDRFDPIIALTENRRTFRLLNPSGRSIRVIRVDGCVIKRKLACDWAMEIPVVPREVFIELKGTDVAHAIEQLKATIIAISSDPKNLEKKSFIVSTNCPLASTQLQRAGLYFRKNYNSALVVRTRQHEESVS